MIKLTQTESVRTTVTIPVTELERAEIDRQFAAMADDDEFQAFNTQMAEAFTDSDWEAFRMAEKSA